MPVALFVLALFLRVGFLSMHPRPLTSDEVDYDELGWTLASTGTYSVNGHPTAYRAVGYPAVVAAVYRVAGRSPAAVKLVQAVCDSCTVLLLFFLFSRRSRAAGLLAGLLWAVFPAAILFTNQLFPESVVVFALTAFAVLLDRSDASGRALAWAAGLILGGLVLLKPALILFAASLPFALHKAGPDRRNLAFLAWCCLPIALWVGRNALVMEAPVLTTSAGANLFIGNNPHATGGYAAVNPADAPAPAASETEANFVAARAAMDYVLRQPGRALTTGIKKVFFLISLEGELVVGNFVKNVGDSSARFAAKYRAAPLWSHVLVSLPSALIVILGTLGLATRRTDLIGRMFYALLFATVIWTVVFFGGSRFRFPLMVFLSGFAAEFIVEREARARAWTPRRAGFSVAACAAFVFVWAAEIFLVTMPSPAP